MNSSSLNSIRYGLSKHLKEQCGIDLKSEEFSTSKQMFKSKIQDLKKNGLGSVEHKMEIAPEDMKILSAKDCLGMSVDTPRGLLKKVWFNIMYFLCRRSRENLRSLTKNTFAVSRDAAGREYVHQAIDEADKNHRSESAPGDTIGEGKMYARFGDPTCPVADFKKYVSKLSTGIEDLWQRQLDTFNDKDHVWYCKSPVGKNTLGNMMPEISRLCKLSKRYTNHCIRATTISTLERVWIEARHIMNTSGHRSETSIRSYSCHLSEDKQRQMTDCLNSALVSTITTSDENIVNNELESLTHNEVMELFSDECFLLKWQLNLSLPLYQSNNVKSNSHCHSQSVLYTPTIMTSVL